jgi:hypothetical protein
LDRAQRDQSAAKGRTSGTPKISSQLPTRRIPADRKIDGRNEHTGTRSALRTRSVAARAARRRFSFLHRFVHIELIEDAIACE